MKFGVMYDFRNPRGAWWKPYPTLLREFLGQIVGIEEMGYDNIWVTEHHFVEDDYNPSVMTAMAAIAARTERIRIGSFVMLMPFQDPVRIAEDGACVDNWSNGRLELGVGQGYRIDEFAGFCMPRRERSARMAEGIELVDRLWDAGAGDLRRPVQSGQGGHAQPEAGAKTAAADLDRRTSRESGAARGRARLQPDGHDRSRS
jgi:alkanesulfonate monooxygenase SsuD/methylene tetrahydromethanopterin reductase-like flavin-dependent oxidoreductase (luciferase family)